MLCQFWWGMCLTFDVITRSCRSVYKDVSSQRIQEFLTSNLFNLSEPHTWKYEHCLNKWCYEALFYWSYELRPEGIRCFTTHFWALSESRGKKRAWRCKLKLSMRWNFSITCSTFCYSNGSRPFLVSERINHWFWDNILLLRMFFLICVFLLLVTFC